MMLKDKPVSKLWELNVIGIEDPNSEENRYEKETKEASTFNKTIKINSESRNEVSLLWKERHPYLPSNVNISIKRLE